jgi:hypothetical protein
MVKVYESVREELRFVMPIFLLLALFASPGNSVEQPITGGPALRDQAERTARLSSPIFVFHSDEFWLNLHHFLYVLGRAENKTRDASREAVVDAPADQKNGLARSWRVDGRGTRDEARAELIKRLATDLRK